MLGIGLTGFACSGKDTAADYLVKKYDFQKIVLSEIIAEELEKRRMQITKINRAHLGEELRRRYGDAFLAKRAVERAKKERYDKVVFSGVRLLKEVEYFKDNLQRFFLVAVNANAEKRFERRSSLDAQTKQDFFERDKHDIIHFGLARVVESADFTIPNNSTLEDLHKAIDEFIAKI